MAKSKDRPTKGSKKPASKPKPKSTPASKKPLHGGGAGAAHFGGGYQG